MLPFFHHATQRSQDTPVEEEREVSNEASDPVIEDPTTGELLLMPLVVVLARRRGL